MEKWFYVKIFNVKIFSIFFSNQVVTENLTSVARVLTERLDLLHNDTEHRAEKDWTEKESNSSTKSSFDEKTFVDKNQATRIAKVWFL